MSNLGNMLHGIFSNDNFKNLLPSHSRNVNVMYQTREIVNKLSWTNDFLPLLNKKYWPSKENKKSLKLLILKGIDKSYRADLWFFASGAKREMVNNKGLYDFLVNEYPEEFPSPFLAQIELDLHRTFPEDPFFHDAKIIKKLKNILLAFSRRNISIGYVQGFNFIVGRILKIVPNEESAFWIFCQIIEYILPINYFSEMSGLMVDIDIIISLINNYFPDLIDYLDSNFFLEFFKNILFQWFISLFIQNFNEECSLLIWDILLIDRSLVLFKVVIGLIKLIKNELMHITELEAFKNFLKDKFLNFNDKAYLMYILILRKFEFNLEVIEKNRNLLLSKISERINHINKSKIDRKLEKLKLNKDEVCNSAWQTCVYDIEGTYRVRDFFIYRIDETPLISENHFDEKMIKFNKILKSNFSDNSSTVSNSKNFSGRLDTKSNNSSITIENKSTDNNSSGMTSNTKNLINNSYFNINNYSNNYTEFSENIIFDYNKKFKFRDISLDTYSYNNFLLERRDHICMFRNKTKNNYTRCSIHLYASSDDKSEIHNSSSNEDTSINNEDYNLNKSLNKKSTYDESSSIKRTEYKNKRKNKIKNDFISTISYNQYQKKKKKEKDFQEFITNLNAKYNLMSSGKNFNLADFDVKKKLESDNVSLDSNIDS